MRRYGCIVGLMLVGGVAMSADAKSVENKRMQKLELTWVGKDEPIAVEPRILIEDAERSNRAKDPNTENLLIHGDNLLALKALEAKYAGKVKCIYIDPPYNTGSAFEHYDDNLEHSKWLNLMRPRLEILWRLLSDDGSIWISIDDREGAYLRAMCDEIYGRFNFVNCIHWQRAYSPKGDSKTIATAGEYVMVYRKTAEWRPNKMPRTAEMDKKYKNPDNDIAPWRSSDAFGPSASTHQGMVYAIQHPFTGAMIYPYANGCWRYEQGEMLRIMRGWAEYELHELDDAEKRAAICGVSVDTVRKGVKAIVLAKSLEESKKSAAEVLKRGQWPKYFFSSNGKGGIARKTYLTDVNGPAPTNWWPFEEVGHTDEAKKEVIALFGAGNAFATPKPERLIHRIVHIASNPGDLVLDSFLGSGTTAAVAQKMNRRWIGIEMGDHAYTHCKVRLDKVIAGEDGGGITKAVDWKGGGGYRFYELAPTLVRIDSFGEPIINEAYNPEMLAAAMALHEGFTYEPDAKHFWKQAHSDANGKAWLYTTTKHVSRAYLNAIAADMADGEFLVIACSSFDSAAAKAFPNIKVKKIPQMLLKRCEFDKTDYALNIVAAPAEEEEE